MNKEDNIQIQMRHFKMENVRLHREVSRLSQYAIFLEDENKTIESEVRAECQVTIDMLNYRVEVLNAKVDAAEKIAASESRRADEEATKVTEREKEISRLKENLKKYEDLQKIADAAEESNMDYKDILEVIKRRTFQRNSDATRFLNGLLQQCPLSPQILP